MCADKITCGDDLKQKGILNSICLKLKNDENICGILFMGSVARGTAPPESDLDIMVLGECDKFVVETIDGILVEYIYTTPETAREKLINNDMEVYHYLGSLIIYDKDGQLERLMDFAVEKYNHFTTGPDVKKQISHWLSSTKIKLSSALNAKDAVKINFLTSTNSWKVIEAIWAVNHKPVPPSGSVALFKDSLLHIPFADWFEHLFVGTDVSRANTMLRIIDWVLPGLDQ